MRRPRGLGDNSLEELRDAQAKSEPEPQQVGGHVADVPDSDRERAVGFT